MRGCRALNDREIEGVLQSFIGPFALRDKALFILGLKSGYRISEMLSLRIGDVLENGVFVDRVLVKRSYMKLKMEGRAVLLHPKVKLALSAWIEEMKIERPIDKETFIFRSKKGSNHPIGRIQAWKILKKAYRLADLIGPGLGTHSLRKTFASKMYSQLKFDLLKLQKSLGHKSVNSTAQYLSFKESEIDDAILAI